MPRSKLREPAKQAAAKQAELDAQTLLLAGAQGRIEELKFELEGLASEVTKKNSEIELAHSQRDAAHAEKKALEKALEQQNDLLIAAEDGEIDEPNLPSA